jgi:autotransporter-associated beta strand protein
MLLGLLFAGAASADAQTTVYTWTGGGSNSEYLYNPENWLDETPPPQPEDGPAIADALANTELLFGPAAKTTYTEYYHLFANRLNFSGITRSFYLYGDYDTTHLGTGGIVYNPAANITSYLGGRVQLEADQTWNIAGGTFVLYDAIKDLGAGYYLTKTGAGTLQLTETYDDNWSGGMTLAAGKVVINPSYDYYDDVIHSLGAGTLTFSGGTLVTQPNLEDYYYYYDDYPVYLTNPVVSNGTISIQNGVEMYWQDGGVTLAADTLLDVTGRPLFIESNISESGGARSLSMNSGGAVVLTGTNSYTGGTSVDKGILIFATTESLPAMPVTNALAVGALGYIGFGDDGSENSGASQTNPQGLFIDRFNKAATFGTVGFDTDPDLYTSTNFSGSIDLTGFAATARLGSATHAILSGSITPQGADYRFGGGGGFLEVGSYLTDGAGSRGVVVDSPAAAPLTVRLTQGDNDFTGAISATNSAVILAQGVSSTAALNLGTGGYIGAEDPSTIQSFVNRFATTVQGVIGVSSTDYTLYSEDSIDLSAFTNGVYIGTTQLGYVDDGIGGGAVLMGNITSGNGGADPYRFAGYKGGLLRVESDLSGTAGVLIGDPTSPGTFGDYLNREFSTVGLIGDNSALSGNITLYGGQLYVGGQYAVPTTALGTGALIVQGMSLPPEWINWDGSALTPQLAAEWGAIIPNAITLNTELNVSPWMSLELSGKVSGAGRLFLQEETYVTLSNDANDFTGGIYVSTEAELYLTANHAAGLGTLSFGYSSGEAIFNTTSPVIHGLESDQYYAYLEVEAPDATLEINQNVDTTYSGSLRADYYDGEDKSGRFLKTGTGTLRLDGVAIYSYGLADGQGNDVSLEIQDGTVVLANSTYIEGGIVKLSGGTLALENSYLSRPVLAQSGVLSGNGYFYGTVTLGGNAVLSPGYSPGKMTFANGLTLLQGSAMNFEVQSAGGDAGIGYDTVEITFGSLDFSAVSAGGFTLKLISLAANGSAGNVSDFSADTNYSWLLFSTTGITAFDPSKVALDTSLFSNSLDAGMGNGWFSLTQTGNELFLNFSPVPEPSTYALLAVGLGMVGLRWRRRANR